MTREEATAAIKARCHYCECFPKCVHDRPECFKASEMAIRSLEAWNEVIKFIRGRIDYWDAPCSGDEAIREELALVMWEIHKKLKEVEE